MVVVVVNESENAKMVNQIECSGIITMSWASHLIRIM